MKYILDTCTVSGYVKGDPKILKRMKQTRPEQICISTVTTMELEFGLRLNTARARKIEEALEPLLRVIEILPFREADAKAAGAIRASLKLKGNQIGYYDVLLAGCALSRGLIMVTANVKEFRRVHGLVVENWSA